MKIKKKLLGICIVAVVFAINCASFGTANSDKWLEFELPPSRVNYTGKKTGTGHLSDGTEFNIFYASSLEKDAGFYYNLLMQDFGWRHDGQKWVGPQTARHLFFSARDIWSV